MKQLQNITGKNYEIIEILPNGIRLFFYVNILKKKIDYFHLLWHFIIIILTKVYHTNLHQFPRDSTFFKSRIYLQLNYTIFI